MILKSHFINRNLCLELHQINLSITIETFIKLPHHFFVLILQFYSPTLVIDLGGSIPSKYEYFHSILLLLLDFLVGDHLFPRRGRYSIENSDDFSTHSIELIGFILISLNSDNQICHFSVNLTRTCCSNF